MKKILMAVLLLAIPFALAMAQMGEVVEEVIVKINDDVITLSDFNSRMDAISGQLEQRLDGEELEKANAEYRKALFNVLINTKLLEQRAKRLGLRMPESYFQQTIEFFKEESRSSTDEEFQAALAGAGMTLEDVRIIAEQRYMQSALFQREVFYQEEENLESKVQEYYERNAARYRSVESYRLSQIVFPFTTGNEGAVSAQAAAALERIRGGEDFGEVYRDLTPQAAPTADGDIGTVLPENMREELRDAVVGKSAGDVTDVIRLDTAFVLIKVTGKEEARLIPLEEIQQQVFNDMQNERVAKGLQDLIIRYKNESYVEVKSLDFMALYDPKSTRLEL